MATYFKYGPNFIHQGSDVQLSVNKAAKFNRRGYRESLKVSYSLKGNLLLTNGDLTAQMAAIENAYSVDNVDCGLYFDSACTLASQHTIRVGDTIGGTRVTHLSWDGGEGNQLATMQGYSITIEADFAGQNNILEFHESISIHGNGGPRVLVLESLQGNPQSQTVCQFTKVTATQRGTAKGMFGYVDIPGPLWPEYLRNDLAGGGRDSPVVAVNDAWQYPNSWEYSFESPEALSGIPNSM